MMSLKDSVTADCILTLKVLNTSMQQLGTTKLGMLY